MGLNEILPGQLYQRGHFLTWTYERKARMLSGNKIDVVVNLWNKVDPDLSGQCIYINWPISGAERDPAAMPMVMSVALLLKRGHVVLVHCEAGVNRSVWFCAEVVAALKGWPLEQALAHVSELVPRSKIREGLLDG